MKKKYTCFFYIFFFVLFGGNCYSQNVGINTSGATPNANAIVDVNANPNNNQGLLIPRMTKIQRIALKNPATGLLIYNTTSNTLYIYNGSGWQQLTGTSVSTSSGVGVANGGGVAINTTGNAPAASALLDISSTTKGLLIPRTTQGSVTAVAGLIIYNNTTNAINVYNGSSWTAPCYSFSDNTTGSGATVNGVAINTTGAAPDPSAILDISSTSKGLLLPSITSAQRDAVPSPDIGLLIYCTTDGALEYWTGSAWMALLAAPISATASASPNPICIGSPLTITGSATGATGWSWAGPNSFSAGTQNGTIGTFTFSNQGTYTLTASNGCGSAAPAATASITSRIAYIPITLTNNQSSATSANFQQMIIVNSSTYSNAENTGLQNVEFSTGAGATGTILQAWIESGATNTSTSTVYWINLGTNTIAASGGTLTVYMNFMPTNVLSSSGPTGEAPQLSGIYGQYDDGDLIFSFYDDFQGSSFNAGNNWVNSGVTCSVSNGFTATATAIDGYIVSKNVAINPASNIVDFYGNVFTNSGGLNWVSVGALDGSETAGTSGYGLGDMIVGSYPIGSQVNGWQRVSLGGLTSTGAMQTSSAAAIWTVTPISASTTNFYVNYGGMQSVTTNADSYPLYEGLMAAGAYNTTYTFNSPVTITWYRVRLYPPANVMPVTTFGSLMCY